MKLYKEIKIDRDKTKSVIFVRLLPIDTKHGTEWLIRMGEEDIITLKEALNNITDGK